MADYEAVTVNDTACSYLAQRYGVGSRYDAAVLLTAAVEALRAAGWTVDRPDQEGS